MTEDQFKALCNTYGFAPSRALREMLDKAMEQAFTPVPTKVEGGWYCPVCHASGRAKGQP
jgi:hypothetical protein